MCVPLKPHTSPLQVISEALQARISSETAAGRVSGLMRMVANIWSLLQSLDAFDAWTLAQAQPQQVHGGGEAPTAAPQLPIGKEAELGGRCA